MTHSSKRRKQHRASDLQGGIASLWSVNEGGLGMGVQGLKMEPGKRREEKRREERKCCKGSLEQRTFLQETAIRTLSINGLGKAG